VIIRILSEGQFEVPDESVEALNQLDAQLEAALEAADQAALTTALEALLARVRETGSALPLDSLTPSDLVLPYTTATVAEVRDLVSGDGLIPG
jgi:hypothetical protein